MFGRSLSTSVHPPGLLLVIYCFLSEIHPRPSSLKKELKRTYTSSSKETVIFLCTKQGAVYDAL